MIEHPILSTQTIGAYFQNSSVPQTGIEVSAKVPWYKTRTCKVVMVGLGILATAGALAAFMSGCFVAAGILGAAGLLCVGISLIQTPFDSKPLAQRNLSSALFDQSNNPILSSHATISDLETPAPNLPEIRGAKVQWRRYIHDVDVKATMESYDQFFAKNVTHHPREIPCEAYGQLDKVEDGNIPIDLITPDGLMTLKLKGKLGGGGSKSFHDIGNGQALAMIILPYQAYDELMMHRYLEKLGIPTNEIKPAVIRWEYQGVKYSKATYIAPSFSSYAKQNAFVLDINNTNETADRLSGRKVLSGGQDPFRLENWDGVLTPLVHDVRVLVDNGVHTIRDTLNAILAGKGTKFHTGGHTDYEARVFPFDFSNEFYELRQLPDKKKLSNEEEKAILRAYIEQVVWIQFDVKKHHLPSEWHELIDRLIERYLRKGTHLSGW